MDMGIVLIVEPVGIARLKQIAQGQFGDMVKAVVDVELRRLAVGAELRSDEEAFLMDRGCSRS